jgi:protein gp37
LGPLVIEPYLADWAGMGGMINWVIVGGESGQKARPCDVAWVRSIVDQCKNAEVPVFVKQMGDYSTRVDPTDDVRGPVTKRILWQKRAGSDPAEWPADLRVRQFPIP